MKIILSTRNPSKLLQIQTLFAGTDIELVTLDQAGIDGSAPEDESTLEGNALSKARFAHKYGTWTMADDTGLFINALAGEPGVHSARWAGKDASTADITRYTLDQLEGSGDRTAIFKTVVAVIDPLRQSHIFRGEVSGKLLEAERVPPQPNMPYSAIFVPRGQDLTWAEMTTEQENAISHRGIAFRQALEFLKGQ